MESGLSFFPEVGKAQAGRRLTFTLFPHGDHQQNANGNGIGKHLEEFLRTHTETGDIVVNNEEAAENKGAQNTHVGLPYGEDHQGNGQPATVAEAIVGPDTTGVVHDIIEASRPAIIEPIQVDRYL